MSLSFSYKSTQKIFWAFIILLGVCLFVSVRFQETAVVYLPFALLAILFVLFYDIKLLFFLLIFFIPFSLEYAVSGTLSTDLPDEPMMVFLAACVILYLVYKPSAAGSFFKHPLIQLLLLELLWIIITIIFSYNSLVSVKYFLAKSWYILAFTVGAGLFIKTKRDIVLTGICYTLSMLVVMIYTLYNHASSMFSFAAANHVMHPFFRNHVNYSSLLVCILPMLYMFYHFTDRYKKMMKVVVGLVLVALFFSYARGAWLALIAGILFIYVLKRKQIKLALFSVVMAIIFFVGWLVYNDNYTRFAPDFNTTIFHSNFEEHLVATYELTDVSNAERFYRWIAGVRMSQHELLTGYGPNNFYAHYKRFADKRFRTWVSNNEDHSSVHNYFLLLLIEQGIPGLLLFCILLFSMFIYVEKLYHRIKDDFYKKTVMAIGVILTMITTVIMLSDLIETDKIGSLFYVCIGLLVVIDQKTREERKYLIPA